MPKTRVLRPASDCTDELSFVPFDHPAAVSSSGTTTPHPLPELHSETPVLSFTPPLPAPRHASHHLSTVGHSPVARGAAEFAARVCWAFLVCDLTTAQLRPKSVSGVRRSIPPTHPFLIFAVLGCTREGGWTVLGGVHACVSTCVLFMFDLKAGVWAGVVVFR